MKLSTTHRLPIIAIAVFTLLAASAQATHWPMAGADYGRSGSQPADQAALPMKFRWKSAGGIVTSPIVTAGATLADQRVAYGRITQDASGGDPNGRVRLQRFSDGGSVGDAAGVDLDDEVTRQPPATGTSDPDIFGTPGNQSELAPMDASPHSGAPTQIYVVHNDDNQNNVAWNSTTSSDQTTPSTESNDIALAQIRASDGKRLRDWGIGDDNPLTTGVDTDGYTVDAAPVMGPDDSGKRKILFTAHNGTDKRLFVVTVNSPTSDQPNTFGVEVSPNLPQINTRARVAYALLEDPDAPGLARATALIPTLDGVMTIRLGDEGLDDVGTTITGLGATWSPSIPVQANGNPPSTTPFFYVASQTPSGTVVSKLRQPDSGDRTTFDVVSQSDELSGTPGPALALAQTGTSAGRVVVTTSTNLYTLNTENLSSGDAQLFEQDAASGFGRTAPATSGNLGFAVTDGGQQHVFHLTPVDGELSVPLDENGFQLNEEALNSTSSVGQPALSRGRVVFPANNGVFTYGPSVALLQPQNNARFQGSPTAPAQVPFEAYVFDVSLTTVRFYVDGSKVGSDQPVNDNRASMTYSTSGLSEGPHTVFADATDGTTTETSSPRTFIVDNFGDPTAQLTVSPNPANVNSDVTLNASGSTGTPGENETLTYSFEVDGDDDYNDITGTNAVVTHKFSTPGTKTVGVRVRDSHGDTSTKTATLRVNAPPTVALAASPNPAAAGQTVTIDATGTTDSDGTVAKYEFDLDGNGTFELDNGSNPKTTKAFAATTNVSVRATDNEGGQTIKTVTVTVTAANQPPTASFIVAPNPGVINQDVGFSAAASKDPDGTIAKYEWDFDGNGTFERNTGTSHLAAHRFTSAGVFKVGLRVTDNAGATGTTTVDVIITGSRCVATSRCTPGLTASVSPTRDRRLPYRFTTRGRLRLPAGLPRADGCAGRVSVQVKRGKRTISTRRARLRSNCRFTSTLTLRDRKRLGTASRLRFNVRFLGNRLLKPRRAKTRTVRIG